MFTFKIDEATKDLIFDGQNNLQIVENADEENQSLRTILSTNLGEWFLNSDLGLDYTLLQVKNPDLDIIRQELYSAIMQEVRVSTVDSLDVDYDMELRTLTVAFTATMINGDTITETGEVISI
jgi:phage baseplate assembly protein W